MVERTALLTRQGHVPSEVRILHPPLCLIGSPWFSGRTTGCRPVDGGSTPPGGACGRRGRSSTVERRPEKPQDLVRFQELT